MVDSLGKYLLFAVAAAGIVSVALVAPGLVKLIPYLSKIPLKRINQEIKRLQKRGLVEIIKKKNGVTSIRLTKLGKEKLARYKIEDLAIEKPKDWDGKWRVIIFDIPVKKNQQRTLLRKKMKMMGFYKLQNSVFIHPYPCFELVTFIRDYFDVSSEVEYLEVDRLESQDKLMNYYFG